MHEFGKLDIDGRRQLEVTRSAVRAFFDAKLEGSSSARVLSPAMPELQVFDLKTSR